MYLAIEGVIGVGKTTLARLLQPAFQAILLLEVFEENPFLSKFYADRARYAFQTQMFFLLSRYHQQRRGIPQLSASGSNLISDYTFEKDALFASINLHDDELEMYNRVHEALAEKIPPPNLILYLRASTDLLMDRISQRGRAYERNMDRGYIQEVNQAYDEFFYKSRSHVAPVMVIDADPLDFVRFPDHLTEIENRVRAALEEAPFQPQLPMSPELPHASHRPFLSEPDPHDSPFSEGFKGGQDA